MKDTIAKVRAIVSMKSCLIDALRADLEAASAKIMALEAENEELRSSVEWWQAQDRDEAWIASLADEEAERRGLKVDVTVEAPDKYCVTLPNGDCISTDPRCMHNADVDS